jgi:phosphoribosylglycinamide formyltransferase-1
MIATSRRKYRIAVGVSGSGRSLKNLVERQSQGPFEVAYVFCSSAAAAALNIAKDAGIRTDVFDFSQATIADTADRLYETLRAFEIDLVVLAGFLKMMPVHDAWKNRLINIHPALLPKFGGKGMYGSKVHAAVLRSGESVSGATVHFVNDQYDEGRMISQVMVPVLPDDSAETLAARVFAAECELLPWVIGEMAHRAVGEGCDLTRFRWQDGGLQR